jgi:very-short-patch-repair endonuclease
MLYSALLIAFRPYHVVVVAQEIIGPYIADFCIYPARVVIEVDGPSHRPAKQAAYDARRDTFMRNLGMKVLRFTNLQVESDAQEIAARIVAQCGTLELMSDHPTPIKIPAVEKTEWEPRKIVDVYKWNVGPKGSKRQTFRTGSLSSKSAICAV